MVRYHLDSDRRRVALDEGSELRGIPKERDAAERGGGEQTRENLAKLPADAARPEGSGVHQQ